MSLPVYLKFLESSDPDFAQAIEKVFASAMTPGALDQKTKLLIALALDAAHGASQGVSSIAKQLRGQGTSDAEIAEALRIAYFAFGNSILATSSAAFANNDKP
ncbi:MULTISPECIES: carboxymuconolactone decarboxylase family protein [Desulfosporosinus]|uniref:Carboxymuconolactone decarboxylase family protein n=1 Tax=Desulfosporosinus acididurans TaxID=476652 RepID=A0A0J1FWH8_9FIRM|nr:MULTISPECIES: carboxymuconolactone decarboxylase family protein [Desulfosporosinus]KLU67343.1 carboxymuconolactone decarboxylase family protein [Desulfosporosinus acididurans]